MHLLPLKRMKNVIKSHSLRYLIKGIPLGAWEFAHHGREEQCTSLRKSTSLTKALLKVISIDIDKRLHDVTRRLTLPFVLECSLGPCC
jgi:hypothetical protein